MHTTIDTQTGQRFRWNTTIIVDGYAVPARITTRTMVHLHPLRVPAKLLATLNTVKDGQQPICAKRFRYRAALIVAGNRRLRTRLRRLAALADRLVPII